jgi:hypothetical protein
MNQWLVATLCVGLALAAGLLSVRAAISARLRPAVAGVVVSVFPVPMDEVPRRLRTRLADLHRLDWAHPGRARASPASTGDALSRIPGHHQPLSRRRPPRADGGARGTLPHALPWPSSEIGDCGGLALPDMLG